MYKSCKYCGRIHKAESVCHAKPIRKRIRKEDDRARRFRDTYAWQKKRAEIQGRDHYLCKVCLSEGRITYEALEVHHIDPLSERFNLRLTNENLISLCEAHHKDAENGTISRALLIDLAKQDIPPLPHSRR